MAEAAKSNAQRLIIYGAPTMTKVYATAYDDDEAALQISNCAKRHSTLLNIRSVDAAAYVHRG